MAQTKLLALLWLLAISTPSFAQEKEGKARRSEFSLNYVMSNTYLFYRYKEFGNHTSTYDTSATLKVKSKGGFGFGLGGFVPIYPSKGSNMLALSIGGSFNMITWDISNIADNEFDEGSLFMSGVPTSSTMILSFMLGLDYKYGCDAAMDKGQKFSFTIGAGGAPMATMTQFGLIPVGASLKIKPYAKAEVGFMAGICMKLRVLYTIGGIDYISYNDKNDDYQESLYMTDKSNVVVSLVLMPLSFKWQKKDKWDR